MRLPPLTIVAMVFAIISGVLAAYLLLVIARVANTPLGGLSASGEAFAWAMGLTFCCSATGFGLAFKWPRAAGAVILGGTVVAALIVGVPRFEHPGTRDLLTLWLITGVPAIVAGVCAVLAPQARRGQVDYYGYGYSAQWPSYQSPYWQQNVGWQHRPYAQGQVFCESCGQPLSVGDRFCRGCGVEQSS